MKIGTIFPNADIGTDPAAIRGFARAVEDAGFDYLLSYDHVTGAHPDRFAGATIPGFAGPPYVHDSPFHEPLALFSHLAAVTSRLEFATSVLVLPQRQTPLVAKQAAEVDMLSGGRLRLAVGVGWNFAEYASLDADFAHRGSRLEEQILVMKLLWTQPLVTFRGRWHDLDRIAITPRPGRPLPVWIGGGADDHLLRRVARHADGWMPLLPATEDVAAAVARLRGFLAGERRDPASFGLDVRIRAAGGGSDEWIAAARRWRSLGATHVCLNGIVRGTPALQQLETAIEMKRAVEDVLRA
jgi:probable F420-dependent oxidoreductase